MAVSREQALQILKERGVSIDDAPQEAAPTNQQDAGDILGRALLKILPQGAVQAIGRAGPTIRSAAQAPSVQAILGTGDVVRRNVANILPESLRPGFRPVGDPTRTSYKAGEGVGDLLSFLAAGEAGAGAEALPGIGRGLESIPGWIKRIGGSTLFGTAVDPNRLKGAERGALFGAGGEVIPAAAGIAKYASPQRLTDSIMGYIKGGRSVEGNAKSLASDIKNSFEKRRGEASDIYNPLFDSVGDSSIYGDIVKSPQLYNNLDKSISDGYLPDIKKLHNEFIKNPTLQNAHDLQSQLGFEVRRLERQPVRSIADTRDMQNWRSARDSLQKDTDSFLNSQDKTGDLSKMYNDATEHYRNNVVPYLSNSGIAKIARGQVTNPKNITTLFKSPSEDVAKVVEDLGDEGRKKILYAELGKKIKMTPEGLTSEISKLEPKGLSSYITPTLQNQLDKMPARIATKTALQRGAGLAAGLALAPKAIGIAPEILAGAGGAALTPAIMNAIQRSVPISAIGRGIGAAFPTARAGILGNILGGSIPEPKTQPSITKEQAIEELKRRGIQ